MKKNPVPPKNVPPSLDPSTSDDVEKVLPIILADTKSGYPDSGRSETKSNTFHDITNILTGGEDEHFKVHMLLDGSASTLQHNKVLVFKDNASSGSGMSVKLVADMLSESNQGIVALLESQGVSRNDIIAGLDSKFREVIFTLSTQVGTNSYMHWLTKALSEGEVAKGTLGSLGILSAISVLVASANSPEISETVQIELKDDIRKFFASLKSRLVSLISEKANNKSFRLSLAGFLLPDHDELQFFSRLEQVFGDKIFKELEKEYVSFSAQIKLLTAHLSSVYSISNDLLGPDLQSMTFELFKMELIETIQSHIYNENSTDTVKADPPVFLLTRAIQRMYEDAGDSILAMIRDLNTYFSLHRSLVRSINSLNNVSSSETVTSAMLTSFSSMMLQLRHTSSEESAVKTLQVLTSSPAFNGTLAGRMYNLSGVNIVETKPLTTKDYTDILRLSGSVFSSNRLFSLDVQPHYNFLGLSKLNNLSFPTGTVFSLKKGTLSWSDLLPESLVQSNDLLKNPSLLKVIDSCVTLIGDPVSSPLYNDLFSFMVVRCLTSSKIKQAVSASVGHEVGAPFKISEAVKKVILPRLDVLSNCVAAHLACGYFAHYAIQLLALSAIRKNLDFIKNFQSEDYRSLSTYLKSIGFSETVSVVEESVDSAISHLSDLINDYVSIDEMMSSFSDEINYIPYASSTKEKSIDNIIGATVTRHDMRLLTSTVAISLSKYVVSENNEQTVLVTSLANRLSDRIKKTSLDLITSATNSDGLVPMTESSVAYRISEIRKRFANLSSVKAFDTATSKQISLRMGLSPFVTLSSETKASKDEKNDTLATFAASSVRQIQSIIRSDYFIVDRSSGALQKHAYRLISPVLLRLLCAIALESLEDFRMRSSYEIVDIPFDEEEGALNNILNLVGISPDLRLSESDVSLLKELITAGSVFSVTKKDFKNFKRPTILDIIKLRPSLVASAKLQKRMIFGHLDNSITQYLFEDRIIVNHENATSAVFTYDSFTGEVRPIISRGKSRISLLMDGLETDDLRREITTNASLLGIVFDKGILPLTQKLWE